MRATSEVTQGVHVTEEGRGAADVTGPAPRHFVAPRLRVLFWGAVRQPPFASRYDCAVRGRHADLVFVAESRDLSPAASLYR